MIVPTREDGRSGREDHSTTTLSRDDLRTNTKLLQKEFFRLNPWWICPKGESEPTIAAKTPLGAVNMALYISDWERAHIIAPNGVRMSVMFVHRYLCVGQERA